jgi:hypothetical protein
LKFHPDLQEVDGRHFFFSFFVMESVPIEVVIVSLSINFPVLGCPIHGGNNGILYSPAVCETVYETEVQSLSGLHRYASNTSNCHAGYVSQDGAYFLMIPSYERLVKLEIKVIYFNLATEISESAQRSR